MAGRHMHGATKHFGTTDVGLFSRGSDLYGKEVAKICAQCLAVLGASPVESFAPPLQPEVKAKATRTGAVIACSFSSVHFLIRAFG